LTPQQNRIRTGSAFLLGGGRLAAFTGINHLAMVTADMDKTVRFWRDLWACAWSWGLAIPDTGTIFSRLRTKDMIAFFEWPHVAPIAEKDHGAPVRGPVAFDHLSFGVESIDELKRLKDLLGEPTTSGLRRSSTTDSSFRSTLSIPTTSPSNSAMPCPNTTCMPIRS
jgi:catechol 2,3-dioxygenase-like lactoylglutathione lyase family enzyme